MLKSDDNKSFEEKATEMEKKIESDDGILFSIGMSSLFRMAMVIFTIYGLFGYPIGFLSKVFIFIINWLLPEINAIILIIQWCGFASFGFDFGWMGNVGASLLLLNVACDVVLAYKLAKFDDSSIEEDKNDE